jgi:hypothetical protein
MKWSDLKSAISSRDINQISRNVLTYNMEYNTTDLIMEDKYADEEMVEIVNVNQLRNIYDLGPYMNFYSLFLFAKV